MAEFEANSEDGKRLYISDDLDRSEANYRSALSLAERMEWIDGIIITKTRLGVVLTAKANRGILDYSAAEREYLEAIEICNKASTCSSLYLGPIYDHLVNLYIIKFKDAEKAERIIADVVRIGEKISVDRTTKERLIDYEYQMRINGFTKQAELLKSQLK